jgi:type II secretory pathway pseudopilin PulG
MAAFFLLIAVLIGVVLVDAVLENTATSSASLFDRTIDQLSTGELMIVFAGLGFLLALFLFLAFGSSRTRRSRRRELKSRRRDAEGRVDELERENARLRHELSNTSEKLDGVERGRTDAVAERDRAEATADRMRAATATDDRPQRTGEQAGVDEPAPVPPQPTSVSRERLDDRTDVTEAREEHARAADEHTRAAEEHARAAEEEARRR